MVSGTDWKGGDRPGQCGVSGVDPDALFLVTGPRQRRTYSPPASGRWYCLRQPYVRSGGPQRMRTALWRGCGHSAFSLPGKSRTAVLRIPDGRGFCPFLLCRAIQSSETERAASPGHGAVQRVWDAVPIKKCLRHINSPAPQS